MDEFAKRDINYTTVMLGVTDDTNKSLAQIRVDPVTKRLLIDNDALPENTDGIYIGDIKFGESLPAGVNNIGQVTVANSSIPVTQSGTWDIGTVTTLTGITNALPTGTNTIGSVKITDGTDLVLVDSSGNLMVNLGVKLSSSTDSIVGVGDIAHDAVDSGNPVKIGAKAVLFDASAPPNVAAAEGDRVNAIADEYGRQYVVDVHPNYWSVSADYAVAQTNTSVKAAPGVGLSLYITDILISNGATAGNITLLNGSGGTVVLKTYPAINGGCVMNLRTPIKLTTNTALCITSITVTTHSISITGFIAP